VYVLDVQYAPSASLTESTRSSGSGAGFPGFSGDVFDEMPHDRVHEEADRRDPGTR